MTDDTARATAAVIPRRRRSAPRIGPVKYCPACRTELDGFGPHYRCPCCERAVMAADVDTEFHARERAAA